MKKLGIIVFAFVLIVGIYILFQFQAMGEWLGNPKDSNDKNEITVEIPSGTSVRGALYILIKAGVIEKSPFVRFVGKVGKSVPSVQAGEYVVSASESPLIILRKLAHGKIKTYSFTIKEGLRITEIALELEKFGFGKARELIALSKDKVFLKRNNINSLEGYLFPSTYSVPKGQTMESVATMMVQMFKKQWTKEMSSKATLLGMTSYQALVAASIIEKEAGGKKEYPIVSSVIRNRLKKRMRLQMDPTVIYGVKNFNGNLTRKHLETDHPWNTYTRGGLPPTPICNPGLGALKAAVEPAETNYLYFVSMNNGTHKFTSTLKEHNKAVRKYQIRGHVGP